MEERWLSMKRPYNFRFLWKRLTYVTGLSKNKHSRNSWKNIPPTVSTVNTYRYVNMYMYRKVQKDANVIRAWNKMKFLAGWPDWTNFRLLGDYFLWAVFLNNWSSQNFRLIFSFFDKKMDWDTILAIFIKPIWSPCFEAWWITSCQALTML
jgi:hypothetical protein